MIFTNGKAQADELAAALQKAGLEVGIMHGDLSPRERKRTLRQIQDLRYQYVVATDLASRGIDIKGVAILIIDHLLKGNHSNLNVWGGPHVRGLVAWPIV